MHFRGADGPVPGRDARGCIVGCIDAPHYASPIRDLVSHPN
jgi:hypothetical protein